MTATVIASSAADLERLMPIALAARSALLKSDGENAYEALHGAAGINVTSEPDGPVTCTFDNDVNSLDVLHGPLGMTISANDLSPTEVTIAPHEGRSLGAVCRDTLSRIIDAVSPQAGMALRSDRNERPH